MTKFLTDKIGITIRWTESVNALRGIVSKWPAVSFLPRLEYICVLDIGLLLVFPCHISRNFHTCWNWNVGECLLVCFISQFTSDTVCLYLSCIIRIYSLKAKVVLFNYTIVLRVLNEICGNSVNDYSTNKISLNKRIVPTLARAQLHLSSFNFSMY